MRWGLDRTQCRPAHHPARQPLRTRNRAWAHALRPGHVRNATSCPSVRPPLPPLPHKRLPRTTRQAVEGLLSTGLPRLGCVTELTWLLGAGPWDPPPSLQQRRAEAEQAGLPPPLQADHVPVAAVSAKVTTPSCCRRTASTSIPWRLPACPNGGSSLRSLSTTTSKRAPRLPHSVLMRATPAPHTPVAHIHVDSCARA